jgi:hypothetical protein
MLREGIYTLLEGLDVLRGDDLFQTQENDRLGVKEEGRHIVQVAYV